MCNSIIDATYMCLQKKFNRNIPLKSVVIRNNVDIEKQEENDAILRIEADDIGVICNFDSGLKYAEKSGCTPYSVIWYELILSSCLQKPVKITSFNYKEGVRSTFLYLELRYTILNSGNTSAKIIKNIITKELRSCFKRDFNVKIFNKEKTKIIVEVFNDKIKDDIAHLLNKYISSGFNIIIQTI